MLVISVIILAEVKGNMLFKMQNAKSKMQNFGRGFVLVFLYLLRGVYVVMTGRSDNYSALSCIACISMFFFTKSY